MRHWTAPAELTEAIAEIASRADLRLTWSDWVGLEEMLEALESLERRWRKDAPLGLEIAERLSLLTLGELGLAMRASPTLGDAFAHLARFHSSLTSLVRIEFDETVGRLGLHYRLPERRCLTLIHEIGATLLVRIGRDVTGVRWTPRRVRLTRAVTRADVWRAYLGVAPEVGARVELQLDADTLRLETLKPDALVMRFLETRAARETESAPITVVDRLRLWLNDKLDRAPTSTECARALGMSRRTLQRHLSAHHTSYSAELAFLRRRRALELIGLGERVQDVAHATGYSDASSFARAHRRWFGRAPRNHSH